MKDYTQAYNQLSNDGIKFSNDFFQLSSSSQGIIHDTAKNFGYRKPKDANGSLARYFFALLKRRYFVDNGHN